MYELGHRLRNQPCSVTMPHPKKVSVGTTNHRIRPEPILQEHQCLHHGTPQRLTGQHTRNSPHYNNGSSNALQEVSQRILLNSSSLTILSKVFPKRPCRTNSSQIMNGKSNREEYGSKRYYEGTVWLLAHPCIILSVHSWTAAKKGKLNLEWEKAKKTKIKLPLTS